MRQQPVILVPQPKLQFNAHHELLPCDDTEKLAAKRHPIRHPVSTEQWGYIGEVRASHLMGLQWRPFPACCCPSPLSVSTPLPQTLREAYD